MATSGSPSGSPWAEIWPRQTTPVTGKSSGRGLNPWTNPLLGMTQGNGHGHESEHGSRSPLDVPPAWDGASPETQLPAYLKALEAWDVTTRTIPRQRGVAVLSQATGDLRTLLATMDLSELTNDHAVSLIRKLLRREFAWTLQRALPLKFEQALFAPAGQRQKNESFLSYTARKSTALRELAVAGLDLPEAARGALGRPEADTMATWLQGDYSGEKVVGFLRNLDRLPGGTGKALALVAEEEEENENELYFEGDEEYWEGEEEHQSGDEVISEDLAQHIFATMGGHGGKSGYTQHRAQIQQHKLARGFPSHPSTTNSGGNAPKGKGQKGPTSKGKGRD
eukprot:4427204-Amphidinium_carterae.1